ncbi:MAG: DAK2 domain-containing protein [Chloroflexota bacterium]
MASRTCDGEGLLAAFREAVATLEAHVDEVNALNVFPVPDGDTGSNMAATANAALEEAERADVTRVDRIAQAASFGALMGARGNSGVIASQILAGIAHGMAGKRRFDGLDLANALDEATKTAYKAVSKPVEGTILTVIREASAEAVRAAEGNNDVVAVLEATVVAARRAVARTPSLLPILREAHVVDSGGQGLLRLLEGALAAARGEPSAVRAVATETREKEAVRGPAPVAAAATDGAAQSYETVFLVTARAGADLDVDAIRASVGRLGESVLVAGDRRMVKVHVHNDRPDEVLAYGLSLGTLTRVTIENLDSQASEVREARAATFVGESVSAGSVGTATTSILERTAGQPVDALVDASSTDELVTVVAPTRFPLGVVAVAPSTSLGAVLEEAAIELREYGVFRVVIGGQANNPSTGELLRAIEETAAEEVVLLPNNPNVTLAARQCLGMVERPMVVVPTRNVAEGVAALFELDLARGAAENAEPMLSAARAVQTLQVTNAVRDATLGGRKVKRGQVIVLDPDDGLVAVDRDVTRAVLAGVATLEPRFELLTVYYGAEATLADAEALARQIGEVAPAAEVRVVHGGQPHYRYLIAAEG